MTTPSHPHGSWEFLFLMTCVGVFMISCGWYGGKLFLRLVGILIGIKDL